MAYQHTTSKGKTLFLNSRVQVSKGGKETTHYYFSKVVKNGVDALPTGKVINESESGLVFLSNAPAPAEPAAATA
jgi:hypothetical protein